MYTVSLANRLWPLRELWGQILFYSKFIVNGSQILNSIRRFNDTLLLCLH
jgi:hypothetical protein